MATLTATVTESVTLNGAVRGSTNSFSVADITNVYERTVTCTHSQQTVIASFNSNSYGSAVQLDLENTKYIRITNVSGSGVMDLAIVGESSNYQVVMTAGTSHILCQADTVMKGEADTDPDFGTLQDITTIIVKPRASTDVDVEIFVGLL